MLDVSILNETKEFYIAFQYIKTCKSGVFSNDNRYLLSLRISRFKKIIINEAVFYIQAENDKPKFKMGLSHAHFVVYCACVFAT